jgi:hypothetical protein
LDLELLVAKLKPITLVLQSDDEQTSENVSTMIPNTTFSAMESYNRLREAMGGLTDRRDHNEEADVKEDGTHSVLGECVVLVWGNIGAEAVQQAASNRGNIALR